MLEDLLDHLFVLDKSEDSHLTLALGAGWGINLTYFLNHSDLDAVGSQIFRLQDRGNQVIEVFLLPKATGGIAILAIIADHLLPLVWDMRCHGCKLIEGIKDLLLFERMEFTGAVPNNS